MATHPTTGSLSAARRRHARLRTQRRIRRLALILVGITTCALVAWFVVRPPQNAAPPSIAVESGDQFFELMHTAASGAPPPPTASGIVFHVEYKNGQAVVTADNVPSSPCVSAGWKLVRRGMLSINGTTPIRVSAARLAELCNQSGAARVVWVPRPE